MSRTSYTVAEAARVLGCTEQALRVAIGQGAFPGRFLSSGALRLPSAAVDEARSTWTPSESESESGSRRDASVGDIVASMRAALLETRDEIVAELLAPLTSQGRRIRQLEDEVASLRRELLAVRNPESLVSLGSRSLDEVVDLVRELAALESELTDDD